jgi:hypothetical protein
MTIRAAIKRIEKLRNEIRKVMRDLRKGKSSKAVAKKVLQEAKGIRDTLRKEIKGAKALKAPAAAKKGGVVRKGAKRLKPAVKKAKKR